jgi:hypothetical protein
MESMAAGGTLWCEPPAKMSADELAALLGCAAAPAHLNNAPTTNPNGASTADQRNSQPHSNCGDLNISLNGANISLNDSWCGPVTPDSPLNNSCALNVSLDPETVDILNESNTSTADGVLNCDVSVADDSGEMWFTQLV